MRRTHGTRQGTRSILKRSKSERGRVNIGRIMHNYSEGDLVSIVLDGGQQKGMPHRRFQGMTVLLNQNKVVHMLSLSLIRTRRRR